MFKTLFEDQEVIQKLRDHGFGDFIDALMKHEDEIYTKKGRLNKSAACRIIGCSPKELDEKRLACQEILAPEFT